MAAVILTSVVGWAVGVRGSDTRPLFSPAEGGLGDGQISTGIQGTLPAIIRESSGVAVSSTDPALLWTHNDGGDGRLFLVSRGGQLVGSFRTAGVDVTDIEDIEVSVCPSGQTGSCLYLADTGDNGRDRDTYAVLVAPEPDPSDRRPSVLTDVAFEALRFRFADESRDVEALAVSPSGEVWIISKGQEGGADVFRIEASVGGAVVDAIPVARLPIDVDEKENRITAAAFNPTGETLVVRSDEVLYIFAATDLEEPTFRCVLPNAGQGEGVDFLGEDLFVVTREGAPAPIEVVQCP